MDILVLKCPAIQLNFLNPNISLVRYEEQILYTMNNVKKKNTKIFRLFLQLFIIYNKTHKQLKTLYNVIIYNKTINNKEPEDWEI